MIAVMGHAILIIIVAIVGGGVASLSRFGIGSILASLLAAFADGGSEPPASWLSSACSFFRRPLGLSLADSCSCFATGFPRR